MKTLILLFLFPIFGYAGDSYIIEDLEKEGQVQALKLNYDKKFSIEGGTITGKTTYTKEVNFTTTTFSGSTTFSKQVTISTGLAVSGQVDLSGNVAFNIPSGSSVTWSCPTGFTAVQAQGNQLGCIQTAEDGSGSYFVASDACFSKYGGRLPLHNEWYIANHFYSLTDPSDDRERCADAVGASANTHVVADSSLTATTNVSDASSVAYRCWIPK